MAPKSTPQAAFGLKYLPVSAKLPTLWRAIETYDSCYGIREGVHHFSGGHDIRYIRFQWVDYTNITRNRIIPVSAFMELLGASRPGVGITKAVFGLIGVSLAPGFSGTGEYLYTPDLTSLRRCGYAPGHASLMGWFEEKSPVQTQEGKDTLEVPLCPRGLLKGIVKCVAHSSTPSTI